MGAPSKLTTSAVLLASAIPLVSAAGDSTSTASPAVSTNIQTANAACSHPNEMAVNSMGKPIKCIGGIWTYQGISDVEFVIVSSNIQASDIGTVKQVIAYCPPGKRIIGGTCGMFSGNTYQSSQNLIIQLPLTDLTGWQCGFGPLNNHATDAYMSGGVWYPAIMSSGAHCGYY